jgi:hypothetical protein
MKETPQQYTARILGHVEGKDPLAILAATPDRLARLIERVPMEELTRRPAPDKWCVRDIIAHLEDGEIVGAFRIRFILGSPGASIVAFDQDKWAATGHYDRRDPFTSLARFRAVREGNVALLQSLDNDQWNAYGVHSERGRESIEHIVRMFAGHDVGHLQQIEKILVQET